MATAVISGIQQIGVGVEDIQTAWRWYRRVFGLDVPVFDDQGEASYMGRYTGGSPKNRHAILAVNLQGGSGFEVWQFTDRKPEAPKFDIQMGDLGIFLTRIKSVDVDTVYDLYKSQDVDLLGTVAKDPVGNKQFFLRDPFGNYFQVVESLEWFTREKKPTGGACGCFIGVSDIEASLPLYAGVLGYDKTVYDETGVFDDLRSLPGGDARVRRVLLTHAKLRRGLLSRWIGSSQIELVQCLSRSPQKIFNDRYWGDLGFIHLCFDIRGMADLKSRCDEAGFPFTVDSTQAFEMEDSSGHFSYVEDPDGTLVEFVEIHRIPIIRKLGLFLDLTKRNPEKPLPDWMIRMFSFGRVKD